MIEDMAGNVWVVRRFKGVIQMMGWDVDDEPLASDWIDAEPSDVADYCRWADGSEGRGDA